MYFYTECARDWCANTIHILYSSISCLDISLTTVRPTLASWEKEIKMSCMEKDPLLTCLIVLLLYLPWPIHHSGRRPGRCSSACSWSDVCVSSLQSIQLRQEDGDEVDKLPDQLSQTFLPIMIFFHLSLHFSRFQHA